MINAVQRTYAAQPVYYASNYTKNANTDVKKTNSEPWLPSDYNSVYFSEYLVKLSKGLSVAYGCKVTVKEQIEKVSSNYANELNKIEEQNYDEDERLERIDALNRNFDLLLRSVAYNNDVFKYESLMHRNNGYSEFLLEYKVEDRNGELCETRSKEILSHKEENTALFKKLRDQFNDYAYFFYENFINSIRDGDFSSVLEESLSSAKERLAAKGVQYDALTAFVKDELPHVGNEYYWYTSKTL